MDFQFGRWRANTPRQIVTRLIESSYRQCHRYRNDSYLNPLRRICFILIFRSTISLEDIRALCGTRTHCGTWWSLLETPAQILSCCYMFSRRFPLMNTRQETYEPIYDSVIIQSKFLADHIHQPHYVLKDLSILSSDPRSLVQQRIQSMQVLPVPRSHSWRIRNGLWLAL